MQISMHQACTHVPWLCVIAVLSVPQAQTSQIRCAYSTHKRRTCATLHVLCTCTRVVPRLRCRKRAQTRGPHNDQSDHKIHSKHAIRMWIHRAFSSTCTSCIVSHNADTHVPTDTYTDFSMYQLSSESARTKLHTLTCTLKAYKHMYAGMQPVQYSQPPNICSYIHYN